MLHSRVMTTTFIPMETMNKNLLTSLLLLALALPFLAACSPSSPLPGLAKGPAEKLEVTSVRLDLPFDTSGQFDRVHLARLNDDAFPDLVVQRFRPQNSVYASLGNKTGFGPFEEWLKGFGGFASEQHTLFADLNGDGLEDAMVQKKNHNIWTAVNRKGRMGNKQRSYTGGASVVDLPTMTDDINNDGCAEIVFVNLWQDICIARNICDAKKPNQIKFHHHLVALHMPEDPRGLRVLAADINGDKLKDWLIFTGSKDGETWKAHQVWAAITQHGSLKAKKPYLAAKTPLGGFGGEAWPPSVIDVNGDTLADIVFHTKDGSLYAALNDGTGHFKVSPKRRCCIAPGSSYPLQMRAFPGQKGVFAAAVRRGEPIIDYATLSW